MPQQPAPSSNNHRMTGQGCHYSTADMVGRYLRRADGLGTSPRLPSYYSSCDREFWIPSRCKIPGCIGDFLSQQVCLAATPGTKLGLHPAALSWSAARGGAAPEPERRLAVSFGRVTVSGYEAVCTGLHRHQAHVTPGY